MNVSHGQRSKANQLGCARDWNLSRNHFIGVGGGPEVVEASVQWQTLTTTKSGHAPIIY